MGCLGFLVVWLTTSRGGVGVDPDSAAYLSAADSVVEQQRFGGLMPGTDFTSWPPLYPLFLVPGVILGAPETGARVVGGIAFGVLVAAAAVGASRVASSLVATAVVGSVVLLSTGIVQVASFARSDVPFAALVALFLLSVTGTRNTGRSALASGALAGAASLTRYVGVVTVPIGVAVLLWSRARTRHVLVFLAIAGTGLVAWIVRNYAVSSTLTGERRSAAEGLDETLRQTAQTIGAWLQPGHPYPALLLGSLFAVVALAATIGQRPSRLEVASGAFCVVYVGTIVASAATVALDPIRHRFLAPIYVPLLWLALGAARRIGRRAASLVGGRLVALALVVVLAGWGWFQVARIDVVLDNVEAASLKGLPTWTRADERRAKRISERIYSNAPDTVFLRTGSRVSIAPRRLPYRSDEEIDDVGPLADELGRSGPAALVWFPDAHRANAYTPGELRAFVDVRRIARAGDAVLYRLSLRASARFR